MVCALTLERHEGSAARPGPHQVSPITNEDPTRSRRQAPIKQAYTFINDLMFLIWVFGSTFSLDTVRMSYFWLYMREIKLALRSGQEGNLPIHKI